MKEYGLVLSGGGAKGSFEIGVWKALIEMNINIRAVAGTSVGALNAAIIAQGDYDLAVYVWKNITMDAVVKMNKSLTDKYISQWSKNDFDTFRKEFRDYLYRGGLDTTPLRNTLNELIDEEKIRNSDIRLGLVTVSLDSLQPQELMIEDIPEGQLVDYLMASAAFPVFQNQKINGKNYIDGGFYDNLPINLLASAGYQNLITVDFLALGFKQKVIEGKALSIKNITNSEHIGLTLEFDPERMKKNIHLGYLDALKSYKKAMGKNYYLDLGGEDRFFEYFRNNLGSCNFPENRQNKINILLGLPTEHSSNEFIKALHNVFRTTAYKKEGFYLSLLEITARALGVERLKLYSPDGLIREIINVSNTHIKQNAEFFSNKHLITDLVKQNKNDTVYKPLNTLMFLGYYLYFVSLDNRFNGPLINAVRRFSPDVTISIITLLSIGEMIKTMNKQLESKN